MVLSEIFSRLCLTTPTITSTNDPSELEKGPEDSQHSSGTYVETPRLPDFRKHYDSFGETQHEFLSTYPQYHSSLLDDIRKTDFKRLDKLVYLDYTGASLYPESLVKQSNDYLTTTVLGNPHSSNPPSRLASQHTLAARSAVLNYLGADPEVYCVVWTSNASTAMRIVGEGYPWHSTSRLFLGHDSHNSINGLRAFAHSKGAAVDYYPISPIGGWEEKWSLLQRLSDHRPPSSDGFPGIFCLTGQSNVTGYKAPLYLLQHAASQGFHTLLDAAALAPSTRISLSGPELNNSIDAITISIYKIVGFPTGLGALVVKKKFLQKLRKPWFSGGTVEVAQVPGEIYTLVDGPERFEDGTINFLSMLTVPRGLSLMTKLIPILSQRLSCLTHWTVRALTELKHVRTGKRLVHVRSPSADISLASLSQIHGALIAFEVTDAEGSFVHCEAIEYGAGKAGICLRAGCMCNPGGTSELADMTFMMKSLTHSCRKEDLETRFGVRSRGVVRASFGIASNFGDAWAFVEYMRSLTQPNSLQHLLDDWAEYTVLAEH